MLLSVAKNLMASRAKHVTFLREVVMSGREAVAERKGTDRLPEAANASL